jgi:hypothetical protein
MKSDLSDESPQLGWSTVKLLFIEILFMTGDISVIHGTPSPPLDLRLLPMVLSRSKLQLHFLYSQILCDYMLIIHVQLKHYETISKRAAHSVRQIENFGALEV